MAYYCGKRAGKANGSTDGTVQACHVTKMCLSCPEKPAEASRASAAPHNSRGRGWALRESGDRVYLLSLSLRLLSFALSFIINLSRSPCAFAPRRLPQGQSGKGWESI